jgi:hypothetical protein
MCRRFPWFTSFGVCPANIFGPNPALPICAPMDRRHRQKSDTRTTYCSILFLSVAMMDRSFFLRREKGFTWSRKFGRRSDGCEELVLKLAMNSIYGKLAQRIGGTLDKHGDLQPPTIANPWCAGATTAWCRAKVLDAATQKPHAIVNFATDGIISIEPLAPVEPILQGAPLYKLPIIAGLRVVDDNFHGKMLGTWTYEQAPTGIFV